MKKIFYSITILIILAWSNISVAQLAKDSWAFGIGFKYPRFLSVNTTISSTNYGAYLSIQRNFSEHIALRLKGGYGHMEGEFVNALNAVTTTTDVISGDLDLMFYLVPCEPISPYLFGGVGLIYRMLGNKFTATIDDNALSGQLNTGIGLEWMFNDNLRIISEFGYNITLNSELDGSISINEINARDTYFSISIGLNWYFDKGEQSKFCQLYSGLSTQAMPDPVDYDRIEEMIKRHIPREVVKEVVVEKPVAASIEKWILVGVNFDFNSAKISPDSYPILYDAAKTLLRYTDIKVEIQGYTDNIGSESYNMKLSQLRADAVKTYLQAKGVSSNRLKATGYGEGNPIADNKTDIGRSMNRRIEFKIQ
jgi:OOP family OmpA-OmpF porin